MHHLGAVIAGLRQKAINIRQSTIWMGHMVTIIMVCCLIKQCGRLCRSIEKLSADSKKETTSNAIIALGQVLSQSNDCVRSHIRDGHMIQ